MQGLPSLQLFAPPPLQLPPLHWSLMVHAFPSEQPLELFENTHPDPALQESLVQAFPSLHFFEPPPLQLPPWQ